jgi:hypothetical protein
MLNPPARPPTETPGAAAGAAAAGALGRDLQPRLRIPSVCEALAGRVEATLAQLLEARGGMRLAPAQQHELILTFTGSCSSRRPPEVPAKGGGQVRDALLLLEL